MRGNKASSVQAARVVVREENGRTIVEAHGDWLVGTIGAVYKTMADIENSNLASEITIDLNYLDRIDTAGAYLLGRVTRECDNQFADFHFIGQHSIARGLIREVWRRNSVCTPPDKKTFGFLRAMARIGAGLEALYMEVVDSFAFFGKVLITGGRTFLQPGRFRLTPTIWAMEEVGVNAMPIVAVLSFFIGAVLAFMGASLLGSLGFDVFTVDLVGIAVLREFGALITAIMIAARSDSAFTASIGSMKMQQEIDDMSVLGLDPYEALVLPRVIACVLMAPLLTFGAMLSGIFGGMITAWIVQDISPIAFIARIQSEVGFEHLLVGLSKAPVFGLVIAIIGCRQGMQVENDVESLGRRVTASVVQSIFMVIVIDAVFSMLYMEMGI